jgi:glycosyltransferase involved in cell wall biosynthesis
MRILHVTDGYRPRLGGIEVFVEDLAGRQTRAGHEVTVLTAAAGPEEEAGSDDAGGIRVVRTPVGPRHPLAPPLARETALAGAYDVVHAHFSVVSPYAMTVARLTDEAGLATVSTVHSMWASRKSIVRAVGSLVDWDRSSLAWTAVSEAAAVDVRAVLGPATAVRVVPNAVDVGWWRDGPGRAPTDGPVTVVSVLRMAGRKRPFALLRMLEALRARVPADVELRALLVGDGPLAHKVQAEIARGPLAGWVSMLGRRSREEIRDLYAVSDVYVSPAYEESFGIAALEARAAGLPVVAMRSGGVGEFVEDGVEGLLCPDDAGMAEALVRLCGDDVLRTRMAAFNALHPPRQDWRGVLADFDDVYRRARTVREQVQREGSDRPAGRRRGWTD